MCGIAGIVAPAAKEYSAALERMTGSLAHRGPDGSGIHFFEGCGLGHRRLSIVDLGTGCQPMLSAAGRTAITFNGEIYGYREIRRELGGYPFQTTSDTEVILALHHRYGDRFVTRLPGMFAFALWDDDRRELLCARDRFGEKPFYYAIGPRGEFIFASEIKSILASGLVDPVIDREAVAHYLKYLYVSPRRSIYRNVHTLPPAHLLCFREGEIRVERFWDLPIPGPSMGLSEATERFQELLDQAVARQLVADVPVGAFLSGGLDSSTIVALAARHEARLQTFSFGFEEATGELPYAREVARRYSTDHTELFDQGTDIAELLVEMAKVYDEPFADSSNIPTYLLSKLAREHVKVVLTGDGGDELMGGYADWYRPLLRMEQGKGAAPPALYKLLRFALKFARRSGVHLPAGWFHAVKGGELAARYGSVHQAHSAQQALFGDREIDRFGLPVVPIPPMERMGSVDDAMRMDLQTYMPGDILVKIDRAAMANGLELRAPFLDVDFASFCIALPHRLKVTGVGDKVILRQAFADAWPASLRTRSKLGFGAPVGRWLLRPSVKRLKEAYLNNQGGRLYSLLPFSETHPMTRRNDYRTWALLVLAIWLERQDVSLG